MAEIKCWGWRSCGVSLWKHLPAGAHGVPRASWPQPQPAGPVVAPAGLRHIPSAGALHAPGAADPQQLCRRRWDCSCGELARSASSPSGTDPQNLAIPLKTGLILAKRLQKGSSEHCWCSALSFEGSALPAYPGIAEGASLWSSPPNCKPPRAPIGVHYSKQLLKSQRCGDGSSLAVLWSPLSQETPLRHGVNKLPTHLRIKTTRGL